tara:strand:- start:43326 stop:43904 length:579 start_codon:yes stop_codon:yes gene_type:complete
MGCNCGKKKKQQQLKKFKEEKEKKLSIRKSWVDLRKEVSRNLTLVQSFGLSMASRGIRNKKIDGPVKQLRVLSCFGNQGVGGELIPCEGLKESKTEGRHFCGLCGCGDRSGTHLISNGEKYSKLDYPVLSCPLQMPGFSNYEPSDEEDRLPPMSRKAYIDNRLTPQDIQKIEVSVPEKDEKLKKEIEEHIKD